MHMYMQIISTCWAVSEALVLAFLDCSSKSFNFVEQNQTLRSMSMNFQSKLNLSGKLLNLHNSFLLAYISTLVSLPRIPISD